jgi:hypothetical protein
MNLLGGKTCGRFPLKKPDTYIHLIPSAHTHTSMRVLVRHTKQILIYRRSCGSVRSVGFEDRTWHFARRSSPVAVRTLYFALRTLHSRETPPRLSVRTSHFDLGPSPGSSPFAHCTSHFALRTSHFALRPVEELARGATRD